jgi:hypothetical protein
MSLSDLRKELKDLRKKAMPTPVSRMKKADCASELARLKGHHAKEEVKVAEVLKEEKVSKPVAKKVEKVQKESHKKEEETMLPSKHRKAEPKTEQAKSKDKKPAKGSEEMRLRMKKLRDMRKAKTDE